MAIKTIKMTDEQLNELYPRAKGYLWHKGQVISERKLKRIKRSKDYDQRVLEKNSLQSLRA